MDTQLNTIKWYELIKGFIIWLAISVGYYTLMQIWIGYDYGFIRRIFAEAMLLRIRPVAEPAYVVLTILTFLAIVYLWIKGYLQRVNDCLFLLISLVLVFCFDVFLASTNHGFIYAISHPFLSTPYEYYADLTKIKGIRSFLRDYVSMMPNLSLHANTHPPGGDLFLYIVERIFGKGVLRASLVSILVTNLSIIPFYLMAKLFLSQHLARLSALLWIVTPNIAIYSATCMDGVFMFFLLLPFYLFFKFAVEDKNLFFLSIVNGIALSAAMFMSFSTCFHGLFFAILTGIFFYKKIHNKGRVLMFLIVSGITFCVVYIMLYFLTGYNIFACLEQAREKDMMNYGSPLRDLKIYLLSRSSNFIGFFSFIGFASSWIWFKYLFKRKMDERANKMLWYYVAAFIITILEMNLGGLYFFETQRIWIFMAQFMIFPAMEFIGSFLKTHPKNYFDVQLLSLAFVQTLVIEIIFYTTW